MSTSASIIILLALKRSLASAGLLPTFFNLNSGFLQGLGRISTSQVTDDLET